jgi:hypothetical protein
MHQITVHEYINVNVWFRALKKQHGEGEREYRRCLTTYLCSSATQAMCASWQASTIADMPDMVI